MKFDIVWELFQWSKIDCAVYATSEDVFTSFRDAKNVSHRLTYYMMLKNIKETAIAFLLNPNAFGTLSWRIGGATTMEAAQVPMESIQLQGRWKSTAMPMHYSNQEQ